MAKKNAPGDDASAVGNSRFAAIQKDPRFNLPRRKAIKGDLDTRFRSALSSDRRFTKHAAIDKYGRKVRSKDAKKELSRYYNFEDEDGADSDSESGESVAGAESSDESESEPESESESESEDESGSESESKIETKPKSKSEAKSKTRPKAAPPKTGPESKVARQQLSKRQLMRGEGASDLSSDESSSDESDIEEALQAQIDEYEQVRGSKESVPDGDETRRIAVVNMDWDNVASTDLMATFSSFVPPNRRILSVKIFPSEYGKKRLQEEEVSGPAQELFDSIDASAPPAKPQDVDEDQDYSSTRLRKYQLQRLQYYYAVVECDAVSTAAAIYDKCDGTEYESTANFFDLRYVPDDVEFTDKPRDECHKLPASYQPTNFTTDALQHSKVKLTWDETPKERARLAQKAFSRADAEDLDLKAYLASDSDGSDGEDAAAKYRALLGGAGSADAGADSDEDGGVEITFNPVLDGKEATLEVTDEPAANADEMTTIEKYRLKEKERRQRRMERYRERKQAEQAESERQSRANTAELDLLAMDDDLGQAAAAAAPAQKPGKKMTRTAAKKKAQNEAETEFDTQDPRFQALFEDPDFAIDSTLPQFKKTKAMEDIMQERRRRQHNGTPRVPGSAQRPRKRVQQDDTAQLVSKLRRKHAA